MKIINKKSRKAIITGATSGIGLSIAQIFLDRGNDVFLCGRKQDKLNKIINTFIDLYGINRVDGCLCDVSELSSVEKMVKKANLFLGEIDVLVNNAGVAYIKNFENLPPEQWNEMINTNLTGVFNCCHVVLPYLKEKGGDIINIGSRSGRYAIKGGVGYNASKFAIQGFTEALFLDLNHYGIRVSLVAPGTVSTGFGNTIEENWHLLPEDVAKVVSDIIEADLRATINWVELRPSKPK